ncbi:MAG TPA: MFS transporter [Candidatus Fimiplasma intestinipullorum]|uniref:MFS transporter n=1 Tax=Candidatus Fimiplasma intestinipullorum TaxID=2840825 RepID=A0A9D1HMM7_9FIRM|nr:MFS transporter [Candidatus Fimiplasma intestinipullorum]
MEKRKEKLGFVMMFVFIVMNFVMSMSGTLFNGILDRIAITMQIDVAMTGYLTSLYAYGAIGAPLLLLVFRKWSRSLMLKGTLLCNMLFGVLSIVATSFPLLLLARFMLGLFGTAYGVLATTSIAALSPPERVGKNLSLLIAGGAASLMVGVPLCRVLIHAYSWQSIYLFLILLMAGGFLYFAFRLPEIGQEKEALHLHQELQMVKVQDVWMVLLCSLITFIGYGAFYTYLTPYIVAFFPALEPAMSLILVMIGACSFLGNLLGGVACDRMGYRQALWVSSLLQIVISIVIFLTTAHLYLNLFFIFLWMFNGWFIGLQLNTGINIVTNRQSNLLVSINGSVIQFAQALGASLASMIISGAGIAFNILLPIITSVMVVGLMCYRPKKSRYIN